MGRFSEMAGVKANEGGVYFVEGSYGAVEILKVSFFENRSKMPTFAIKGKVISGGPDGRGPGSVASQVIVIKAANAETHWSNVKAFAGAVMGIDPNSPATFLESIPADEEEEKAAIDRFWNEAMEMMVDEEEQPFAGEYVALSCSTIQTRAGNDFTKHVWTHLSEAAQQGFGKPASK